MFRVFDHTADLGLEVEAASFEELLAEAGRALFSVIVLNLNDVQPCLEHTIRLARDEPAWVLADWLSELLYVFETRKWLFNQFHITCTSEQIEARCHGEPVDRSRHRLDHEVKAITYHELECRQASDGRWIARVILDI
ncbi:MAG: protein archease [Pirellulaceae bacterium]|nr:MAG: protein archease [Pirellulaceae bacterium]